MDAFHRGFFRLPFKIHDHFFWVSPFTFPMRGWIYQQFCKLAIFDVIGDSYDFIINIDSEAIMIKPFELKSVYRRGKFKLYRNTAIGTDPYRPKYIKSIQKFFKGRLPLEEMNKYGYMDITTILYEKISKKCCRKYKKTVHIGTGNYGWQTR